MYRLSEDLNFAGNKKINPLIFKRIRLIIFDTHEDHFLIISLPNGDNAIAVSLKC
jgi:hypothetical protein